MQIDKKQIGMIIITVLAFSFLIYQIYELITVDVSNDHATSDRNSATVLHQPPSPIPALVTTQPSDSGLLLAHSTNAEAAGNSTQALSHEAIDHHSEPAELDAGMPSSSRPVQQSRSISSIAVTEGHVLSTPLPRLSKQSEQQSAQQHDHDHSGASDHDTTPIMSQHISQPLVVSKQSNDTLNTSLSDSQRTYLSLLTQYKLAKMKRQLLDEEASIAAAEHKIAEYQQKTKQMTQPQRSVDSDQSASEPSASPKTVGPPIASVLNQHYQLAMLDQQSGHWQAILKMGQTYQTIAVGNVLAEGVRVASINASGVILEKSRDHWRLGFDGVAPWAPAKPKHHHRHAAHHRSKHLSGHLGGGFGEHSGKQLGRSLGNAKKQTLLLTSAGHARFADKKTVPLQLIKPKPKPKPKPITYHWQSTPLLSLSPVNVSKTAQHETAQNEVLQHKGLQTKTASQASAHLHPRKMNPTQIPVSREERAAWEAAVPNEADVVVARSTLHRAPTLHEAPPLHSDVSTLQRVSSLQSGSTLQRAAKHPFFTEEEQHILAVPGTHYTIQLYSVNDNTQAAEFEHDLLTAGIKSQTVPCLLEEDGQRWVTLLYGNYTTMADAEVALRYLPTALRRARPWIRSYADIQERLRAREMQGVGE